MKYKIFSMAFLLACSCSSTNQNLKIPTIDNAGINLLATVSGQLVKEGDCLLVLTDDGRRILPIWPTGARLDGSTVVLRDGKRFESSTRVVLSGGLDPDLSQFDTKRRECSADSLFLTNPEQGNRS